MLGSLRLQQVEYRCSSGRGGDATTIHRRGPRPRPPTVGDHRSARVGEAGKSILGRLSYSPVGCRRAGVDSCTRDHLCVIVGVALTMVPARLWRDFLQNPTGIREPAKDEIIERVVAEIVRAFEMEQPQNRIAA